MSYIFRESGILTSVSLHSDEQRLMWNRGITPRVRQAELVAFWKVVWTLDID